MGGTLTYKPTKVLIWGKTYPELSTRHRETVCTGGCLEDGTPVRLYPVDFRYLAGDGQYHLYDWIEVPIAKATMDPRPESYKVRADQIQIGRQLKTTDQWAERRATIFRNPDWHFGCVEDLRREQKVTRRSLGMVRVGDVKNVELLNRPAHERQRHAENLKRLKGKGELFAPAAKDLAFLPFRVRLHWRCDGGSSCPGHSASVMDWGLLELGRREGGEKAKQKLEALTNLRVYDLHLYIGNLFTRQHIFSCIGLWYPKRSPTRTQQDLFG